MSDESDDATISEPARPQNKTLRPESDASPGLPAGALAALRPGPVQRAWAAIRDFLSALRVTGVSLTLSLLTALLLAVPDQMQEAIRILVEGIGRTIVFILVTLGACLVAWYWGRVLTYRLAPDLWELADREAKRWGIVVLPRLAGTLPMLGAAAGFYAAGRTTPAPDPSIATRLGWACGVSVCLTVLLPVFYTYRRHRLGKPTSERVPVGGTNARAENAKAAIDLFDASALVAVVLFVAASWKPVGLLNVPWINAVTLLEIALASWVAIASRILYFGQKRQLPVMTLVVICGFVFTAFDLNDDHQVRTLARNPLPLVPVDRAAEKWLASRADSQSGVPYPVYIVAAEGGGIRAAYIAAQVLGAIQDACPAFAQHLFAISGVSGGSVGGTVYAGLAQRFASNTPSPSCQPSGNAFRSRADSVLSRDFLSPVIAKFLYPDLFQRFLPFPVGAFDRARALEDGFTSAWRQVFPSGWSLGDSFASLWNAGFENGAVPALFLNTTEVETGARVAVSNLAPDASMAGGLVTFGQQDSALNLSASAAAALSARFTYVTPEGAVRLHRGDTLQRHRYVDGGYFEDSGAETAEDIAYALKGWSNAAARPIHPIILRIGYDDGGSSIKPVDHSGFSDLLSPISAVLRTRATRGDVVVKQLSARTIQDSTGPSDVSVIHLVLKQDSVPLILGWQLSDRARRDIYSRTTPRPCAPDAARPPQLGIPDLRIGYCRIFRELREFEGRAPR